MNLKFLFVASLLLGTTAYTAENCCAGSCWEDGCCGTDHCGPGQDPSPIESCSKQIKVSGSATYSPWIGPSDQIQENAEHEADAQAAQKCGHAASRIGDYQIIDAGLNQFGRGTITATAEYCCDL